jgi:hypothetical protein
MPKIFPTENEFKIESCAYLEYFHLFTFATTFFCIKFTVLTLNGMGDIIQASKRVDDVRAQHWVDILNKKLTVTRIVCSQSIYVANDNFVVRVIDICTRRSNSN